MRHRGLHEDHHVEFPYGDSPKPRRGRRAQPSWLSPTFLLGAGVGCAAMWLIVRFSSGLFTAPPPAHPLSPLDDHPAHTHRPNHQGGYHAIIIPAGGQGESAPPPHVLARLQRAAQLYFDSPAPKPYIITTAWGTPHKPCPHDAAGFERHEAADNARWLVGAGVPPSHVLEESTSLETVGNAFFVRVLHTDVRGLRRLAVVNNRFHMPRARAVFEHVFGIPPHPGAPATAYELDFVEVDDRLSDTVLAVRREKEAASLPRFVDGGPWRRATPTLRDMHNWVHQENTAYATKRLLEERKPLDPALLKSY